MFLLIRSRVGAIHISIIERREVCVEHISVKYACICTLIQNLVCKGGKCHWGQNEGIRMWPKQPDNGAGTAWCTSQKLQLFKQFQMYLSSSCICICTLRSSNFSSSSICICQVFVFVFALLRSSNFSSISRCIFQVFVFVFALLRSYNFSSSSRCICRVVVFGIWAFPQWDVLLKSFR